MGSINFSGAGTGIDWSMLIDAQIQARSQQVITPIEHWKASWEDKLGAYDNLRLLLTEFQTSVEAMDSAAELRSYTAKTSNEDSVAVAVSGTARPGTTSLVINQLAAAEMEAHSGLDEATTVVNSSGASQVFAYSYAGQATSVTVPSGTTLEQLAGLINNDPGNPGVTASILDDGTGSTTSHHLVLRGNDMGSANTIVIDAATTTLAGQWSNLTANASAGASAVTVDSVADFSRYQAVIIGDDDSTAEYHVIDSIGGSTLTLKDVLADDFTTDQGAYVTVRGSGSAVSAPATAGTAEVTVADASAFLVGKSVIIADAGGYEELTITEIDTETNTLTFSANLANDYAADAFVTQLEGGRKFTFEDADFTEVQAARNAQLRLDGYPPTGWVERDTNVINDLIPGVTLTLSSTNGGAPVSITISEDIDGVKEKINEFVSNYNAVKTFINENTDYDTESQQAGLLMGSYAATLIEQRLRDVIIGVAPGFQSGTDTYTHLGQLGINTVGDSEDDTLGTLSVDDTKLTEALSTDFDAVIRLFTDNFSGYSSSQYLTFYQASELLTTAGQYEVEADFDGSGNLTAGRMRRVGETAFRDATIDPPYLVGQSGNPEDGLYVKALWDGASTTQSATVRVTRGVAGRIGDLLDEVLDGADGLLHNIGESYRDIISQIDDRIEREQARLDLLRDRLTARYARLEELMVQMQGRQQWVTNMAAGLNLGG